MKTEFETVIFTTPETGTPHLATMQEANPGRVIHVVSNPSTPEGWLNCDRNVREWWRKNRDSVTTSHVLFLEWDVFCNVDLAETLPPCRPVDLLGVRLRTMVQHGRSWKAFSFLKVLPPELRTQGIGFVPFAAVLLSRAALDELADPQHDETFALDVLCEVRTPCIVRSAGLRIAENPLWGNLTTTPRMVPDGFLGIIHPIKTEVPA